MSFNELAAEWHACPRTGAHLEAGLAAGVAGTAD